MQGKVEDTTFKNFVVPFGGAFYIASSIDLEVKKLNIFNIISLSSCTINGVQAGGPGFVFNGNNFYGSELCANNLSTSHASIFFVFSSSGNKQAINNSCVSDCECDSYSILIGKLPCVSNSLNITECSTKQLVNTIHFGWYTSSYYQENFIGCNNTGYTILGHTCSSTAEQKCENIVLIDNDASNAVIGFWYYNHRFINSYFLRNTGLKLHKFSSNAVVTFDRCFNEGITGVSEVNCKTSYQTCIDITKFQYEKYHKDQIKETCKKLIKRMYTYRRQGFKSPIIIYIIEISQ